MHGLVSAELPRLLEGLLAEVDRDNRRAQRAGDLDRREADAPTAVDRDAIAGREIGAVCEGVIGAHVATVERGHRDGGDAVGKDGEVVVGVLDGDPVGERALARGLEPQRDPVLTDVLGTRRVLMGCENRKAILERCRGRFDTADGDPRRG